MSKIVMVLDWFLFLYATLSVLYLCFFAIQSQRKRPEPYPPSYKKSRILILFPAYKEDKVIESSVRSVFQQNYPVDKFLVTVVSDQMQQDTLDRLSKKYPVHILPIENDCKTKAKALQLGVKDVDSGDFDVVVILDADNIVEPEFLSQVNDAYQSGIYAMQAERVAKNPQTDTALLDAASEAMNNSFFRKGQIRVGLSAALSGSGMAFDFIWFKENVLKISTAGEDKELEALLLKEGIYIDYLEETFVYDEKVSDPKSFSRQRKRWLAAQYSILRHAIKEWPAAVLAQNWDYCNKLFQWIMLPRVLLLGMISLFSLVFTIIYWPWSLKWWLLLFGLLVAFSIALPDKLFDNRLKKALKKVPLMFFLMFFNLFKLKDANKTFIHTRHGD